MDRSIGNSDISSIGQTYPLLRHYLQVQKKPQRTYWQRTREAMISARLLPATQAYLAKLLGIEQPSISDWNKPNGYPKMERIVEMARKFDVCVEWLATERGPMHVPPIDPASESMWGMWKRLAQHQRAQVIGFATGIADAGRKNSEPMPVLPHRTAEAAWLAGEIARIDDAGFWVEMEERVRARLKQQIDEQPKKNKRQPEGDRPQSR